MFPEVLSTLRQEFKSWHDKLSHLKPKSMFRIAKPRSLPSRLLDLKDDVHLCESCIFGTARRRQCTTKGMKSGSIGKYNEYKPGDGVSVPNSVSSYIISPTIIRQTHKCTHLDLPMNDGPF